ncbi:MAG: hypothetical protein ACRESZ_09855 [Methylococcales bacterium]
MSPLIVDTVRRWRETREVRAALLMELDKLRLKLACAAYEIEMYFGSINRDFLEWIKPVIEIHKGCHPIDLLWEHINLQLSLTDKEISEQAKHGKARTLEGIDLRKHVVPLLDSKVAVLHQFNVPFQNHLLEIRHHLNVLNEDVDQARYYFSLIFSERIGEENYRQAVTKNLEKCYRDYGNGTRLIVDRIGMLENCSQTTGWILQ